jgi:hypothetical protein
MAIVLRQHGARRVLAFDGSNQKHVARGFFAESEFGHATLFLAVTPAPTTT